MTYRPDIDGLRALAVLPVVLFHAHVTGFDGGFVGVDVFFVISGYLITRLLVDDIEHQRFSLAHFYERRIRRIFPALFVALATATALGWFLLLPDELRRFGASLVSTSLFASNFLFWLEGGYFEAPAETKPLLHTWSLAVEEQFYLVFPLLLPLLLRANARTRKRVVALAAVVSFVLALWLVRRAPGAAFYLAPTRVWELLLGAAVALHLMPAWPTRRSAEFAAWLGLMLVAGSVVALDRHSAFPGLSALYPCLGAALIIHSGSPHRTTVAGLLGLRPLVFIGLASYSLYLWHWIALVFLRVTHLSSPGPGTVALVLVFAGAASVLSWRFVEAPVRRQVWLRSRAGLFAAAAGATLLFATAGGALWLSGGAPSRLPPAARELAAGAGDVWPGFRDCERRLCTVGDGSRPETLLWGDSHVAALAPAFERGRGLAIVAFDRGCPPLVELSRYEARCLSFAEAVLARIRAEGVRWVVLHARWAWYVEGTRFGREVGRPVSLDSLAGLTANPDVFEAALVRTLRQLKAMGVTVTLVGPVPEVGTQVPSALARSALRDADPPTLPAGAFEQRQRRTLAILQRVAAAESVSLVSLHERLCDVDECRLQAAGRALYFDDDHLSRFGAAFVAPALERAPHR